MQWNVTSKADDTSGIMPCGDALPSAKYYGSIMSSDSHQVNALTSKTASLLLPGNHFHVWARCTQHKTGSVCEEVAKKWGLLPSSLCLANLMEQGDLINSCLIILRSHIGSQSSFHPVKSSSPLSVDPLDSIMAASAIVPYAVERMMTRWWESDLEQALGIRSSVEAYNRGVTWKFVSFDDGKLTLARIAILRTIRCANALGV